MNIIGFIPIGILGSKNWRWKIIPVAATFSVALEVTQLISRRGLMEFDDVVHNTLGAVIGFGVFVIGRRIWRRWQGRKQECT